MANHYGVWVHSEIATTGVVVDNQSERLSDEIYNGIDLDHDSMVKLYNDDREAFFVEYDIPDDEQESFDLDEYMSMSNDNPTYLIGQWVKGDDALYSPDTAGEYSAIHSEYTQVVYSRFVTRAPLCSPCCPGQANVSCEGQGGEQLAFTLPPSLWGDGLSDDERERIRTETALFHLGRLSSIVSNWLKRKASIKEVKVVLSNARAALAELGQ